jgi:putative oxidoreductase
LFSARLLKIKTASMRRKEEAMKIVTTIARILLGLVFLVFGANKLHAFMPMGPMPTGVAGQFMGALFASKYLLAVGLCETVGGLLLLINRFVPLGLIFLGPVIVNILLTGILLTHQALLSGIVVAVLWFVVFWRVYPAFRGIFQAKVA